MRDPVVQGFLVVIAVSLLAVSFLSMLPGQRFISFSWRNFLIGCADSILSVDNMITGNTPIAATCASLAVLSFWIWWNKGGGDDTKRRLRDALKKFSPVRRTAPVTS